MSLIVVDVESDGPIPHKYSMVCLGAVIVDDKLDKTYYGKTKPVSDIWIPESLAISGFTREQHLTFDDPKEVFEKFRDWIIKDSHNGRPVMITDNPAYDFAWVNYYFHYYLGKNPFGYSARRIGDLYCGLTKNGHNQWKHLRKTKHDHNPVNDAKGNAEAINEMKKMGLKI